jgi:hypothetical protein
VINEDTWDLSPGILHLIDYEYEFLTSRCKKESKILNDFGYCAVFVLYLLQI